MYAGILHLGRRLPRPIERNPEQLATRSVPVSCRRKPFAGPTVQRRLTVSTAISPNTVVIMFLKSRASFFFKKDLSGKLGKGPI